VSLLLLQALLCSCLGTTGRCRFSCSLSLFWPALMILFLAMLSFYVPAPCRYERALRQNNAVDFDDLLGLTVALLRRRDDVRERYQRRFK
jgi:hypothetical protein